MREVFVLFYFNNGGWKIMIQEEKKERTEEVNTLVAEQNKTKKQEIKEAIQEFIKRIEEDGRLSKIEKGKYKGGGFEIEIL